MKKIFRWIVQFLNALGAGIEIVVTRQCSICHGGRDAYRFNWHCPVCDGKGRL